MKRVLIIHKGDFGKFPPLLSLKNALNKLGYVVDVLTSNNENENLFGDDENCFKVSRNSTLPFFGFFAWYFAFLVKSRNLIRKDYNFIWIEGGDTLAFFGSFIKTRNLKSKYILQISELYDKMPIYRFLIGLSIKRFDKIVMPEINRAYIFKIWFKLPNLPMVLPNKPYYNYLKEFTEDHLLSKKISNITEFAGNRKIILYQGLIATDRKFQGVVSFVNQNDSRYCLVLLGKDLGYLEEIDRYPESVYYAGYFEPPHHLEITKVADICLMAYDITSLNKLYCAPNKLWEYSEMGKPILSQELPVIQSQFKEYNFGVCCDVMDYESVSRAMLKLEENYTEMSQNAVVFASSLDYKEALNGILL